MCQPLIKVDTTCCCSPCKKILLLRLFWHGLCTFVVVAFAQLPLTAAHWQECLYLMAPITSLSLPCSSGMGMDSLYSLEPRYYLAKHMLGFAVPFWHVNPSILIVSLKSLQRQTSLGLQRFTNHCCCNILPPILIFAILSRGVWDKLDQAFIQLKRDTHSPTVPSFCGHSQLF